ncbi:MAG: futalosine hydrolase [Phycisphaerales bacterium]
MSEPAQTGAGESGAALRVLLAVAAPGEARAILTAMRARTELAEHVWRLHSLGPQLDMVVTGVGKAQAAGGVARVLDRARHGLVISAGVGGALPLGGSEHLEIGVAVAATRSVFADEGVLSPSGFVNMADRGFAPGPWTGSGVDIEPEVLAGIQPGCDVAGAVATVSTCSGTDDLAREVVRRTGAIAEAMEGAAVAVAASRAGVRFAEVRVISNRTGENPGWELPRALIRLGEVVAGMVA